MKLLSLFLKDFKGIDEFSIFLNGNNVTIYGDNGTGKTTVADAYYWLLFGKDSLGQADFEIKPLDENNQWIPDKIPTVAMELEYPGGKVKLQKEYVEKWTTPRGSSEKVFSGHTIKYYIDGVPVKKGEFDKRVNEIVDSKNFRLLSDPKYFNDNNQLHWEKRRKLLVEICSDGFTDEDVINSSERFAKINEIRGNRSIDGHLQMLKDKHEKISKRKKEIPVRINEIISHNQNIPAKTEIEQELNEQRKLMQQKQQELALVKNGPVTKIRELETSITQYVTQYKQTIQKDVDAKKEKKDTLKDALLNTRQTVKETELEIKNSKSQIANIEKQLEELRQKYRKANVKPELETFSECPTCLQAVPEEQMLKVHEKIIAEHNIAKSEELAEINKSSKQLISQKDQIGVSIASLENKLYADNQSLKDLESKLAAIEKDIAFLAQQQTGYMEESAFMNLNTELAQLKNRPDSQAEKISQEIEAIQQNIQEKERLLLQIEIYENNQQRISDLKKEEKTSAKELEKIQAEIALFEDFNKTKIKMLESKINSSFSIARFKLFEETNKGTTVEICETLCNGIPYGSLNNGARINIGLDIINKFGEYYNFRPPVFVDNAESITQLLPMDNQVIRLVVVEGESLDAVIEQPAIPVYAGEPDF